MSVPAPCHGNVGTYECDPHIGADLRRARDAPRDNPLQVATMTADLRLHNAQADMAEFAAARAHAELKDYLAQRAKPAKSGGKLSAPRPGRTQPTRRENRVSHPAPGGLTKR